jgi:hypothetical protein
MNEAKFRKIIKDEVETSVAIAVKSQFDQSIGVVMEEFVSQMKVIAEYTKHVDENLMILSGKVDNHEYRLNKAGL